MAQALLQGQGGPPELPRAEDPRFGLGGNGDGEFGFYLSVVLVGTEKVTECWTLEEEGGGGGRNWVDRWEVEGEGAVRGMRGGVGR